MKPSILAAALLLAGTASPVLAQGCPSGATGNLACISQVGDRNSVSIDQADAVTSTAIVSVRGDGNGSGEGQSASTSIARFGNNTPTALLSSDISGGGVDQTGTNQTAIVTIVGDDNVFSVEQAGRGNVAGQTVLGDGNAVGVQQNERGNTSLQLQAGQENYSSVKQNGSRNFALTGQVGLSEFGLLGTTSLQSLMNLGSGGRPGTGTGNTIQLVQQNDANRALLTQVGNDNSIGLQQSGRQTATISQFGNNLSVGLDQTRGPSGITIIQTGRR